MLNSIHSNAKFLLAGLLTGFSISFPYLLPFFFLGNYLFLTGILKRKLNFYNFVQGWLFGFGFFLSSMHWIIYPFLIYEKHHAIAPFIIILFPLLLGTFYSITSILITKFVQHYKVNSSFFFSKCFVISMLFFATEFLRSSIFGGLPFNLNAHIWVFDEKFIKVASYVGVFGLSFLTIYWITLTNLLIYRKSAFFLFSLFLFPTLLISINSFTYMNTNQDQKENILIRVVQPNIQQKQKWNKVFFQDHIDRLIKLSTINTDDTELVVIWPEAALTVYLNEEEDLINYLKRNLKKNITLITGSLRRNFEGNNTKVFNSFYVIRENEITFYDKKRLVPFGEFIPLRFIFNFFKLTPGETDFSRGDGKNILSFKYLEDNIFFEPSICYESIFQTFNLSKIKLFINITNDAWFGNTTGPRQHLTASIFRSVEKGVPFVRSANSGISVIANSNGKVLKKMDLNQIGYLESKLTLSDNSTFFNKYKSFVLILLITIVMILNLVLDLLIKKRKSLKIK